MDSLPEALKKVRIRLAVQSWLCSVSVGLLYAGIACCFCLAITRFFLWGNPLPLCAGIVALGILVPTLLVQRRLPTLVDAALAADQRLNLKERFTSSLELSQREGGMFSALHEDARQHLDHLDVGRDFSFSLPGSVRWLTIPIIVFGIAYIFLPEFDLFGIEARRAEALARAEKVKMQVERLRNEIKPLEELVAEAVDGGPLTEATELIERVSEELERGELTEKQALAKLTDLRDTFKDQLDSMNESNPRPKIAGNNEKLGFAEDMANDIQQGKFSDAAQKAEELQKKLEKGDLSEQELEAMSRDLEKLSKLLGNQSPALSKALAEAAQSLKSGNISAALAVFSEAELAFEDLESIMMQMDMLAKACSTLGNCAGGLCGLADAMGFFKEGDSDRFGPGMGGPGRGQGGTVGELPDVNVGFDPTMLPGPLTDGQNLLSIEQQAAPELGQEAKIEFLQGTFVQAQQRAEQALEQEEIPRGSKEFIRQYFGTLEASTSTSNAGGRP